MLNNKLSTNFGWYRIWCAGRIFISHVAPLCLMIWMIGLPLTGCSQADLAAQKTVWNLTQASMLQKKGKFKESEALYKKVIAQLAEVNDTKYESFKASAVISLANLYMEENRYAEAASKFETALSMFNKSTAPNTRFVQRQKAACLAQYAMALRTMQQPKKADQMEAQAKALRISLEKMGNDSSK